MNISIVAEPLFEIAGFPVTNSMLVGWVMSVLLIILGFCARRRLALVPRGVQNFFEAVLEQVLGMIDSVTHNRDQSKKFFPLIATIFLLIISVNWAGLLPGSGSIGIREMHEGAEILVPFIRSTSADLNFTIALAIISVITVQVVGITSIGFFKYAGRFINFSNPLNFFVGILELVSEIAKLISFSFRLFGNIFAGEVLLTVMTVLVPYIIPLPFLALEVFVGFIQAFVFAILTLVFLKMASEEMTH
ncbi:MAG: F0F1 ATP synthase subunit A [Candidatus Uhrbacteria bacterium]|nr:F0F1 ATP synthase subunit A [Candidatus Uhrbacteria bacterium]